MKKIVFLFLLVLTLSLFACETKMYQIEFVNYDGSVLKTMTVKEGEMPFFTGVPWRKSEDGNKYIFDGWDKEIVKAKSDMTYTATYRIEKDESTYTIRFVNYDDSLIQELQVKAGGMPNISIIPTRVEDEQYAYTFSGWDKEIVKATANATYKAVYSRVDKTTGEYDVTTPWIEG